jgi:hypothetical protein
MARATLIDVAYKYRLNYSTAFFCCCSVMAEITTFTLLSLLGYSTLLLAVLRLAVLLSFFLFGGFFLRKASSHVTMSFRLRL